MDTVRISPSCGVDLDNLSSTNIPMTQVGIRWSCLLLYSLALPV
jgi:hypothetical protein